MKTSSGTEALLSFYTISFAVILICLRSVPDKYFVVIPDVLQVCQLRFELCQVWLVCIKLPLQRNVFRCQLLQRRQLAVMKLIDGLGFFMRFDFCAMLLIEFCRPAGFAKLIVYRFRPTVIPDGLTLTIDFFHAILGLSDESFPFFTGRLQIINLLFQFFQ